MPTITYLQLISLLLAAAAAAQPELNTAIPSDAVSLLSFKSGADLDHKLIYSLTERFDYCQWHGVKCGQGRIVRLSLQGSGLRGTFKPDTLSRLDQLRVLALHNNSLSGPVPDLSGLLNLKSLFLSHNAFSGSFPPSILSLHRLRVLDLSSDDFSGPIPARITGLDRLDTLRLDRNRFTGPLPPLNQTLLDNFNVSGNNLTGPVPATPTLSRFGPTSFAGNPGLCGETVNRACAEPFFGGGSGNNGSSSIPAPLGQSAQSQGAVVVGLSPPAATPLKKPGRTGVILGFTIGVFLLVAGVLVVFSLVRARGGSNGEVNPKSPTELAAAAAAGATEPQRRAAVPIEKSIEAVTKSEELGPPRRVQRSGFLVFCSGEAEQYSLEQLMKASAELLGRGMVGTTYKAVLDNQLVVTVKRLDSSKTAAIEEERFERHMDAVGGLRHPNLVPVRAYFQANGERLIVFDYQPNGSLFNLIHGSRSARAKPLHWTSCLKIAEDVAQGLSYIHQASRLIHGNLKSSNILLGPEFEACLTDYCLSVLLTDDSPKYDDPDSSAYRAPEARTSARRATPKSDVYAFGVLLLELLTGKHPSLQPFLEPVELNEWVQAVRADDGPEDRRLEMLVDVAGVCRLSSPEQRPGMWQVLKMINEIKESAGVDDGDDLGS